jgi:hypothetical protein
MEMMLLVEPMVLLRVAVPMLLLVSQMMYRNGQ